jgi:hypothetical protein
MDKGIFKVIVAGGRDFNDYDLLKTKLDHILCNKRKSHQIYILSGKAKGADSLGERYARENNFQVLSFPANWDLYGRQAGVKRNAEMANEANALIAFWDGESHGTKHMIEIATKKGLNIRTIRYDKVHYSNK